MQRGNLVFYDAIERTYSFRLSNLDAETFQKVAKALELFGIIFRNPRR